MSVKQLRSRLPVFVAAVAVALLQQPAVAQFEPERPRVALTQMPSLVAEVWPADVNEDGITDLVAQQSGTGVVVQLGVGDGTFTSPSLVASGFTPVGVGDLNGDGFIDILMVTQGTTTGHVLAGRGDGTFIGPATLQIALGRPTYVTDMNNDGAADLVSSSTVDPLVPRSQIFVYPGHGDFTFDTATAISFSGQVVMGIAIADLTGDGFPDIALNGAFNRRIDLLVNQGSFSFALTSIPLDRNGGGLAARDLNGDGIVDLVAGMGSWNTTYWLDGALYVLLGLGGGSFAPPVQYPVNIGPVAVVIGDFNGDGLPDIATGNQSAVERCEFQKHLWDSISILPGRGDGTFGPTASFALGDSETAPDTSYSRSLTRLNTSDLNQDGRTDLLSSPGAILLSLPPGDNSAPVANAGSNLVEPPNFTGFEQLRGSASDADHDWLTFEWKDDLGRTWGNLPRQCISANWGQTTRVFTLTVTDGHGGTSTDSMQWTFTGETAPPAPIPEGFASSNIGDATNGFDGVKDGAFRIVGSGSDIWGTSDSFRFVHSQVSGNFDVVTRVDSVENVDRWTKAGLMIRQSLAPDSRHAFLLATPTNVNGVAFQRREFDGGSSVHTAGPATAPPVWLRLVRDGDVITAYTRATPGDAWATVDTQTLPGLSDPVYVGMAVTSHREGALATAFFSGFSINGNTPPGPATLPQGWQAVDVGTVAVPGSAVFDGFGFTVRGSGADIWGSTDAFHFAYTRLAGDGTAIVRVRGLAGPDQWSKAGLMIRESLSPFAAHHFLLRSQSQGLAYQRRQVAGSSTLHTALGPTPGIGWVWYRIQRTGGTISLAYSTEPAGPTAWQPIAESPFPTGEVLIGLAVSSHADGQLATGTFDRVEVTGAETPPPSATWTSDVVGSVALAGSSDTDGTTSTLSASGNDIWGTADAFRYTYRPLTADGSITARVSSLAAPHAWTKAGVMIRASLDPAAAHGFVFVSRDNGLAFQRRVATGTTTTHTAGGSGVAPQWVRLTRAGQVVTGAISADGISWTDVGSDTLAIGTGPVLAGIAVTSHDNAALATATFDNVTVTPP